MTTQPNQHHESNDVSQAMARYAQGDERSFSLVYRAMAPRLYAFLLRETKNAAHAEDLVQQTFLQVHCARSRYLPGTDVAPWLFSIARHLLIDLRRRSRLSTSLSDQEETHTVPAELMSSACADERLYSKQLGSMLETSLRSVPEKHRVAFRLVKLDGLARRSRRDDGNHVGCGQSAHAPHQPDDPRRVAGNAAIAA